MGVLDDAHRDGVVVGLASESEEPVARLDIDVMLLTQPDTFNLMVIALLEIMSVEDLPWEVPAEDKVTKEDKFSWFQMAGIHGLPYKMWDNVEVTDDDYEGRQNDRTRWSYCRHGTPAFESWHRPYLAMLEQTIYRQIAKVAKRFNDSSKLSKEQKDQYQTAAKQFRLPYVDYFRPRGYQRMVPGVTDYDDPLGMGKAGPYPRWRGTNKMIRLPYDYSLPQIFTLPRIVVKTLPNNESKLVQNPFFSFKLPEGFLDDVEWNDSNLDLDVPNIKNYTMRYGTNKPRSVAQMNDNLTKLHEDQLRITLSLLDHNGPYAKFAAFTTSGADGIPANFNSGQGISQSPMGSLETVHNDFHVYYGGFVGTRMWAGKWMKDPRSKTEPTPPEYYGQPHTWAGHMTSVPVAAFDPVFWIHHVQVDRLFAIWQSSNPETWFEDLDAEYDRSLAKRSLKPFRSSKANGEETFWTPDGVRDWTKLGYTYPDLQTKDQTPDDIRKKFVELYGWGRRLKPGEIIGIHRVPPPEMEPLDLSKAQVFQWAIGSTEEYIFEQLGPKHTVKNYAATLGLTSLTISEETEQEPIYEWWIDDAVEKMALNGSFTIFYIIDVNGVAGVSGEDWVQQPGFVGLTHVFTASAEGCAACSTDSEQKKIVTSTTPITSTLLDYVETDRLKSMRPEHVIPFMEEYLKWRVQTVGGQVVDPRYLSLEKQFRITVSHTMRSSDTKKISWQSGDATGNHLDIIKNIIERADKKES